MTNKLNPPYPSSLVAYAIILKSLEANEPITQMHLQKMMYFAHGYHLAKNNQPLITENFEAWRFGPVIPRLYSIYKAYGKDLIKNIDLISEKPDTIELKEISSIAEKSIDFAWDTTKDVDPLILSNWTHKEGSPWANTYREMYSGEINNNEIKSYFEGILNK